MKYSFNFLSISPSYFPYPFSIYSCFLLNLLEIFFLPKDSYFSTFSKTLIEGKEGRKKGGRGSREEEEGERRKGKERKSSWVTDVPAMGGTDNSTPPHLTAVVDRNPLKIRQKDMKRVQGFVIECFFFFWFLNKCIPCFYFDGSGGKGERKNEEREKKTDACKRS